MDLEKPPKVFISYSHDSDQHKDWVLTFASELRGKGVEVFLDQWDLGLGDDVPKYMERSVRDADRVLMICTPTYVRKANDGKGGVGYEAMIVTGELVRDLGTSKFIPVLRHANGNDERPASVATRLYIDLSEHKSESHEAEMDKLLRELHQAPANPKPPIGRNPYATSPSGLELPKTYEALPVLASGGVRNEPAEIYREALGIAKAGDVLAWRLLNQRSRSLISPALTTWRTENEQQQVGSYEALAEQTLKGVEAFSPLFCLALAGIGSGRDGFANQAALLDEVLHPENWNRGGLLVVTAVPEAAGFVYQALAGSMQLFTSQYGPVMRLVRTPITIPLVQGSAPLWKQHSVVGWPESFGRNSEVAWNVLAKLPDTWPWLKDMFGDAEEFSSALVAYYLFLNVNEYAYVVANGQQKELATDKTLDTPLNFMSASVSARRRGYRLLTENITFLAEVWRSIGVSDKAFAAHWPQWMELCRRWHASSLRTWDTSPMPHSQLVDDLVGALGNLE